MSAQKAIRKRVGHYVVSTHWDREWYESFQNYRFRLVRMLDELLDHMQSDPAFRYFQSDGQSILWEDYLEVRPERRDQVTALASEGRLRIGPWYVLPDEFLVSGESLVRNLQMGLKVASQFGQPSRVGFVCDLFGHTGQFPQILRGFNIDNAFVWRGANETTHGAIFRWQSPDDSEVIAYRFSPRHGYCTYAFHVRRGHEPEASLEIEGAMKNLRELADFEMNRCPTSSFLIFDGGDHLEIEPRTTEIFAQAAKELPEIEFVHSHLDGFVEDLREQRDAITKVIQGELREPGEQGDEAWVIPGVLSSRIHLKQANARCENELCLWTEPFSAFASRLGYSYPDRYLEIAWRYLLQNHPHDSICTCSIDQVHKDMTYRFDQCMEIAAHLTRDALGYLAARVELPELGERDFSIVVFNPSANAIDGPVDLTLRFPKEIDTVYQEFFGFEPKIGFRLFDPQDKELPYQYVNQRRETVGFIRRLRKFPEGDMRHEVDVTVPLVVPPFGYARLLCRPVKEPTRYLGTMLVDDHTIENETLRVSAGVNGTLTIHDKRTGQTYDRLLTLEDRADIGDGWYHGVAVNDEIYSSVATAAETAIVADGIAKATLKIRVTLQVPERFRFDVMQRGEQLAPLVVTHFVTLRQGSDAAEVRTEVANTVRDHRLRVLLPSGAKSETCLADQVFDVVERPIALRADNARYKELEVETRPQQTWTAVADGKRGLAVVATGLPEACVRDLPDRPIALTLLRSFRKAVFTGGNEGGQIQGPHTFNYLIVPVQGKVDAGRLCRLGQRLAAGVRSVQLEPRQLRREKADGAPERSLAASGSFLNVQSPHAVVTAVQATGAGGTAIRMFNPTTAGIKVATRLEPPTKKARLANLEGEPRDELKIDKGSVPVDLKPKQIVTVEFSD